MRNALLVVVAVALLVSASAAVAAGNENTGNTVGNCISDGLYGNEPNAADGTAGGPAEHDPGENAGNVVPTQSPGPWVNNPTDPDNPTRGRSVGQFNQDGFNIPEICKSQLGG